MNDAEIKLNIIRLIDTQQGRKLLELYQLIQYKIVTNTSKKEKLSPIELGYKTMAEDIEREKEAFEWIENTNTYAEL